MLTVTFLNSIWLAGFILIQAVILTLSNKEQVNLGAPGWKKEGHPILILSREKKKNFTFRENSKLQNRPDFENIPPFESFEDSVVLVSTNLSRMTNFESQRYQYPVCHP